MGAGAGAWGGGEQKNRNDERRVTLCVCAAIALPVVLIRIFADAPHEKRNLSSRSLPGYGASRQSNRDFVTRRGKGLSSAGVIVLLFLKSASGYRADIWEAR